MSADITKLAKKLVQAQSLRLQLSKIETETKAELLELMQKKKIKEFDLKATMNGRPVKLVGEIKVSSTTVIDTDALAKAMTQEQLIQCATVSVKAAQEVLPKAIIEKCSSLKKGNPTLSVKADGSLTVPEIQFY